MKSYLWTLAVASVFFVTFVHATDLSPTAMVKKGTCPYGYSSSSDYCTPKNGAGFALAKVGSCPSGYSSSGDYCLASKNAKHAVPKVGSCPSNYSSSGAYCLSSK